MAAVSHAAIYRKDRWGGLLSGISIVPYIGDLAKLTRIPSYVDKLRNALALPRQSTERTLARVFDSTKNVGLLPHPVENGVRVTKPAEQVGGGGDQYFLPRAWEVLEAL